jgi:hypothetical protein
MSMNTGRTAVEVAERLQPASSVPHVQAQLNNLAVTCCVCALVCVCVCARGSLNGTEE